MTKAQEYAEQVKKLEELRINRPTFTTVHSGHIHIDSDGDLFCQDALVKGERVPAFIRWLQENFE